MAYIVEQINHASELVMDYDELLTTKERLKCIKDAFSEVSNQIVFEKIGHMEVAILHVKARPVMILSKQISYLGHPHLHYKKRIQIPYTWIELYHQFHKSHDIVFLGVYKYKDNVVFVQFDTEQYVKRVVNNSSAHVYTNDLYQAMTRGIYQKTDAKANKITCIASKHMLAYYRGNEPKQHEVIRCIQSFNRSFPFGEQILGETAYEQMLCAKFNHALQPEWPGFYLEFLFSGHLKQNNAGSVLAYQQNKTKDDDALDFDLWSSKYEFYGDLKASSADTKSILLNDQESMEKAIERHGKIWYLIYEHDTVKDALRGHVTTKYWNKQLNKSNALSYGAKMKGAICFKAVTVLEINKINYRNILKTFNQGVNSDGNTRRAKYMISKSIFADDNYVIYREKYDDKTTI